jgi:hypothetical protein
VIRLLFAASMLALTLGAAAADSPTPLAVGVLAPDTKLVDQNGQSVRLADLTRQRDFVVVAFYVKAFTGAAETSNSPGSGTTTPNTPH